MANAGRSIDHTGSGRLPTMWTFVVRSKRLISSINSDLKIRLMKNQHDPVLLLDEAVTL